MSSNVITHGVIYGVLGMVSAFLMFNGMLGTMTIGIAGILIFILVLVSAGRRYKAENGGYATMGDLVKTFAMVLLIGMLLSVLFQMVYTMTMGEEKKEALIESMVDSQTEMMAKIMPEDQLGELEDQFYESASTMFDPGKLIMGVLFGSFFYILVSLIPAAIMKNNPPDHV